MIYDAEGRMLHGSGTAGRRDHRAPSGPGEVVYALEQIPLLDGEYAVTLCVTSNDGAYIYDWHEQRYRFEVRDSKRSFGSVDFPVRITIDAPSVADRRWGDGGRREPTSASSSSTTTAVT